MNPVALGVIGCGVIGQKHIQSAQEFPLSSVVAVADCNESSVQFATREFNIPKAYTDPERLINDPDVAGIVLAIPTNGRVNLALKALAAGKHVLVEKPAGMNSHEVEQMIAARGNLIAGCCSSRFRFLEGAAAVTDFIASGALGKLRLLRARAVKAAGPPPEVAPPHWRLNRSVNGGGILVNWGCYDLDYLLGITGWAVQPQDVLAQTWGLPPQFLSHVAPGSDGETHYTAVIQCQDGIVINLERGEYAPSPTEEVWQIIGTKGSLRLNMIDQVEKVITFDDASAVTGVVSKVIWSGREDGSKVHFGPIRDFAQAIREQCQPRTSLEQALLIQKITDAIYQSAATGRLIELAK